MLVIVVVLFIICWLPYQLYYVLQSIFPVISQFRYINVIFFCFHWLAMANSCCNPFIYGIYNEKFKREFRIRFTRSLCSGPHESYDMDNASEESRSRFSLQRSLRGRLFGGSTQTTADRINSIRLKQMEPLQQRSGALATDGAPHPV
ncbi:probable G-protein coupled receptor 83 [Pollicipes pollicipes]|nr:probable G-protein coupled receptor 83 [Pollicipes pollicipes]